jgi:DNA-binding NarL/FixJ family response regulator
VLLDKHPLWLEAMKGLVARTGLTVVGTTTSCDAAVAMIAEQRPDVFIAGIEPMDPDQIRCISEAMEVQPGLKAIVVADTTDVEAIRAAFAVGVNIYCAKTAEQDDLASAIRQLFTRSIYISAADGPMLSYEPEVLESASHNLTRRELEILRLAAEGSSNSQLAQKLWVTEQTVKFHLSNIYRKLNVTNRTEASRWAHLNGVLAPQQHDQPISAAV